MHINVLKNRAYTVVKKKGNMYKSIKEEVLGSRLQDDIRPGYSRQAGVHAVLAERRHN
jgi:hypothetical protein